MRWPGFRKVRGQVCKRVARRIQSLELSDVSAYRSYIERHPQEWAQLDRLCRISISRFCRDYNVFEYLAREVLPHLAEQAVSHGEREIRSWSSGCGAGEEVYTLMILWRLLLEPSYPDLMLRVLGTDTDPDQLARAHAGVYPAASLKEMPLAWRQTAFEERASRFLLCQEYRAGVEFQQQDVRQELPDGRFHLVLCRNLVFTYFEESLQRDIAAAIRSRLLPGGVLVLGKHEQLPADTVGFVELASALRIYCRPPAPTAD
jgi:chemotaxis protein methyltransferase CheR